MPSKSIVTEEEVKSFFFKAMLEGWAVDREKTEIAGMPGYKAISFRDGDLYLLDCYCVAPDSPKSAGTTTIWFKNIPVWYMQYGGYYEKSEIPFLKTVLRIAYLSGWFVGGRGPCECEEGSLLYLNRPCGNFSAFSGREDIFTGKKRYFAWIPCISWRYVLTMSVLIISCRLISAAFLFDNSSIKDKIKHCMGEIFKQIKTKTGLRIFAGVFLVILGLLVHLIPLVPGSWIIFIGLEILGVRLLVQDKLKEWLNNSKFFNKKRDTNK